jgi:hypothetical protein
LSFLLAKKERIEVTEKTLERNRGWLTEKTNYGKTKANERICYLIYSKHNGWFER